MIETNFKHTEIGLIPHDWEVKTLEESTQRVSVGLATSVTKYYSRTGVPMFRNLNIKENRLDDSDILYLDEAFANANPTKKIHKDDVLTVHTGYVGISCVVPEKYEGALTFTTLITTTKKEILSPNYLSLYLNSNMGMNEVVLLQAGGGRNNLNVNDFIKLRITLPPTIAEQERIAGALSSIDTLIGALTEQIEKKRHIKQGAMQQLLTGKKRLAGFTGEWKSVKLGEIGETYSGLSGKTADDFGKGDAQYITFLNILNNPIIDTTIFERVQVRSGERQNVVHCGDLFFNTSSETPEEVGICAVILDEIENLYLNSFCFGFRLLDETIDGKYLAYYFRSKEGREIMTTLAQGATRYNLSKSSFCKAEILLPPTIAEQTAIAAVLSGMDTEIAVLEKKRDKYIAIKSGMMQNLLTGKIRLA